MGMIGTVGHAAAEHQACCAITILNRRWQPTSCSPLIMPWHGHLARGDQVRLLLFVTGTLPGKFIHQIVFFSLLLWSVNCSTRSINKKPMPESARCLGFSQAG